MFKEMSDEELKQEFIKYCGKEKWEEEEALSNLLKIEELLSNALAIPRIPVITDDIPIESCLDLKNKCIVISNKIIFNKEEAIKSLVHEYRHLYQYIVIQMHEDHPLHKSWSNNFNNVINWDTLNNDQADYEKYVLQPLEIDSYAYTKYFFEHYLEMPINMFNGQLDDVLNEYIEIIISNGL